VETNVQSMERLFASDGSNVGIPHSVRGVGANVAVAAHSVKQGDTACQLEADERYGILALAEGNGARPGAGIIARWMVGKVAGFLRTHAAEAPPELAELVHYLSLHRDSLAGELRVAGVAPQDVSCGFTGAIFDSQSRTAWVYQAGQSPVALLLRSAAGSPSVERGPSNQASYSGESGFDGDTDRERFDDVSGLALASAEAAGDESIEHVADVVSPGGFNAMARLAVGDATIAMVATSEVWKALPAAVDSGAAFATGDDGDIGTDAGQTGYSPRAESPSTRARGARVERPGAPVADRERSRAPAPGGEEPTRGGESPTPAGRESDERPGRSRKPSGSERAATAGRAEGAVTGTQGAAKRAPASDRRVGTNPPARGGRWKIVAGAVVAVGLMTALGAAVFCNKDDRNERWRADGGIPSPRPSGDVPVIIPATDVPVLPPPPPDAAVPFIPCYAGRWRGRLGRCHVSLALSPNRLSTCGVIRTSDCTVEGLPSALPLTGCRHDSTRVRSRVPVRRIIDELQSRYEALANLRCTDQLVVRCARDGNTVLVSGGLDCGSYPEVNLPTSVFRRVQ
jgi:hypothetical protein